MLTSHRGLQDPCENRALGACDTSHTGFQTSRYYAGLETSRLGMEPNTAGWQIETQHPSTQSRDATPTNPICLLCLLGSSGARARMGPGRRGRYCGLWSRVFLDTLAGATGGNCISRDRNKFVPTDAVASECPCVFQKKISLLLRRTTVETTPRWCCET